MPHVNEGAQAPNGLAVAAQQAAANGHKVAPAKRQTVAPPEALRFLELLGKAPGETFFRCIGQAGTNVSRKGADLHGLKATALEADNTAGSAVYVVVGNATGTSRPTGAVCDADCPTVPALFVEWDDRPIEWQRQAWQELGLPKPSLQVATGGKSCHLYWVLDQPLPADRWRVLQRRLLDHCDADRKLSNPARLMRLPGYRYIDKSTGEATGRRCRLISDTATRYTAETIEAALPPVLELPEPTPATTAPPPPRHRHDLPPRGLEQIEQAAACIPVRVVGQNTYETSRRALCGCAAALAEIGHADPDGHALELLAGKWPDRATAAQALASSTTREAATFWRIAADHGFSLSRTATGSSGVGFGQQQRQEPQEQPRRQQADRLDFEARWSLLERHADGLAGNGWPVMKAMASLAATAGDLDIQRLTSRQLEQLLEAAQRRRRPTAAPIAGGGIFTIQATPWAVEGVFRHGLNLLVGQPGAGKSRLAAACLAAWLRADQTWLNLPMPCDLPTEERHALIIGTDQPLEDWALTLEPVGLVQRLSPTQVRLHPRLTLHPLEAGAQLDSDGLSAIRAWCDQHPGGAVLVDSLAAVLPPGVDEEKPAAARPIHALQEALGSCWGVITHHTRKAAGKEGNLGVGAGRGSSSIDGAVSRVVGLGLIHRMENGVPTPQESDPRRELLSTKRGGATLHLIVRSDSSGLWSNEGSADDLKRQERKERTLAGLTDAQASVLEVLEDADGWLTGRQVVEGLQPPGQDYDNRGTLAASTRKILKRLEAIGLIETQKVARDRLFRLAGTGGEQPQESQESNPLTEERKMTGSNCSNAAPQGISPALMPARPGSDRLYSAPEPGEPPEPGAAGEPPARIEPLEPVRAAGEQPVEQVKPLAPQHESKESNPDSPHGSDGGSIGSGQGSARLQQHRPAAPPAGPIGSGSDAFDHDDDPHWPARPRQAA